MTIGFDNKRVAGNSIRALSVEWWGLEQVVKEMGRKKLETVSINNSFQEFAPRGNKEVGSSLDKDRFGGVVG